MPPRSASAPQRAGVVLVEKLGQLLAQALVGFAVMVEPHRALEHRLLQILRQVAPEIGRGGAENQKITPGGVVDDPIGVLVHSADPWSNIGLARPGIGPRVLLKQCRRSAVPGLRAHSGWMPADLITSLQRAVSDLMKAAASSAEPPPGMMLSW